MEVLATSAIAASSSHFSLSPLFNNHASQVIPWKFSGTKIVKIELQCSLRCIRANCSVKSRISTGGDNDEGAFKQNFLLQPLWSLSKSFSFKFGLYSLSCRWIPKWKKYYSSVHEKINCLEENTPQFYIPFVRVVVGVMLVMSLSVAISKNSAGALTEENLLFLEAWRTIDRAYVDKSFNGQSWFRYRENALRSEPMNTREETYMAIKKMLATLNDPFTRFLEPEKFKSLQSGSQGSVTGVGLSIGYPTKFDGSPPGLVVISAVPGGPANKAGISSGDIILQIDDTSTETMGIYDAADRGPEGSLVKLTIQSRSEIKHLDLTRERVSLNPVKSRLCKKDGVNAFVLDLRDNSGGLFPEGIEIAKIWLDKGVIVYICDNRGVRDIYDTDGSNAIAASEPLVVLVNKGTASASEILAGALKDNKRAVLLGEPTFGKGKIQSVFKLSDGSGLAVTVARYETPAHTDIDKVGVIPDHPLPSLFPNDEDGFCGCLQDSASACYLNQVQLFSR
ncbi:hypothetical protein G4B88_026724 [Cannabis sativa]|uniref:C-terminal processing peptidase n=1 Tax=Cannabis sativa TaxID=3483 RepID=A0A7J6F8Z7_CANSA|nr:hypothetical protein G4B88_026724 [Cannabis sativa]